MDEFCGDDDEFDAEIEEMSPGIPKKELPPDTSHFYTELSTQESVTNRFLAFSHLLRILDKVQRDDVREAGLRIVNALGDKLAADNSTVLTLAK